MADPLKAGSLSSFGNSMAAAMEAAMREEWQAARGSPLPGGVGEVDRKMFFAAVAKGVLRYLYQHRDDFITGSVAHTTGHHRHGMDFDLVEKP
jgi:hypothetical protein